MELLFDSFNSKYIALVDGPEEVELAERSGFFKTELPHRMIATSIEAAAPLAQYAKGDLLNELLAHPGKQKANGMDLLDISRASASDISIPAPPGKDYLPFQKAGIQFCHQRKNILIGDDMGLGKTIQAIGLINLDQTIETALIICPASLRLNWRQELNNWLVTPRSVELPYPSKPFPESEIVIIHYDILHKFKEDLRRKEWDLLVVDEAHYLKNRWAKRTVQILGNNVSTRFKKGISPISARKILMMTGTPIVNRPVDLWPLINRLDPCTWGNFGQFVMRYCGAKDLAHQPSNGASNLQELQTRLRLSVMIRRLKSDVLTDLPPKLRQVIAIPNDSVFKIVETENIAYSKHLGLVSSLREAVKEAKISHDQKSFQEALKKLRQAVKIAWGELARARRQTALAKLPHVLEHLQTVSEKAVIFAHHREVIDKLQDALGVQAVSLHGGVSMTLRNEAVKSFQTDPEIRFFIGSIQAAGVGLTLTASSHVIFAELDWVPSNIMQAEDRCHRIGQKNSVLIQHIVFDGSVDANMAKKIVDKQEIIDQALNNEDSADSAC